MLTSSKLSKMILKQNEENKAHVECNFSDDMLPLKEVITNSELLQDVSFGAFLILPNFLRS